MNNAARPDQNLDPSARAVINANYDTTNIVAMQESIPRIKKTLHSCQDILKAHCGPQSGYAMLVNNLSAGIDFEPSIFTRDGIRILSSVEFLSPLERYVKEMLTYVGKRVDNAAKDGTTTSMLFSSLFLDKILDMIKEINACGLSFFQMNKTIETTFAGILENLKEFTYSIERMNNVAEADEAMKVKTSGLVAYMQALSSSGGNVELAVAMKEIFEKSPSISWDFITSHNSIKETGKAFEVEVCEYDSHLQCITALEGQLDLKLSTEYEAENAEVLVITNPIDDGSIKTDGILKYLREADTDTPISIIARGFSGSITSECFRLNELRHKKIALWQYAPESRFAGQQYPYELLILAAVAGIKPFDMDTPDFIEKDVHIFKAKKLHYHDTFLDFYGIFDDTEENLHPYYLHPEKATQFYKEARESLESQLEMYRDGHKKDGRMFGIFMEMLNRIACIHRPTLRLGGPAHEQVANADVVQDVQGAIMSSLKHGFLINGPISICRAIKIELNKHIDAKNRETSEELIATHDFAIIVLNCMIDSILEVIETVHGESIDTESFIGESDTYINSLNGRGHLNFYDFVEEIKKGEHVDNLSEDGMRLGSTYPVLQPVAITIELLKRMQELLMKFVNTNKIVVYGGVVVNNKDTK
jgi:hypothetical protein